MYSKIYLGWDELRRLVLELNTVLNPHVAERPAIRAHTRQIIYSDLKCIFDHLELSGKPWWDDLKIPPLAVKLWKGLSEEARVAGYVRHFRDLTPRLVKLSRNAGRMYLVYRDAANNSTETNNLGLGPGETCIGGRRMAEKANVHVASVPKGNRELEEAGLVTFVRRLWFNGPFVRRVDMGLDEGPEEPVDADGLRRRAYR
jgi:hypothetical protein